MSLNPKNQRIDEVVKNKLTNRPRRMFLKKNVASRKNIENIKTNNTMIGRIGTLGISSCSGDTK